MLGMSVRRKSAAPGGAGGRVALVESLEPRQLLSAGPLGRAKSPANVTLGGTYAGNLHIGGKAANGTPNRAISISVNSDTPDGQVAGGMSVASMGTFAFTGTVINNQLLLIFHDAAGSVAGQVVARVDSDGSRLVGRVTEQTGGQRISGGFSAAPGGTPVDTSGIPAVVGSTVSSSTFQQKNLIGSYSGHAHLSGPRVFMFSVSPENIALGITRESDPGEVSGTLSLLNVNFNLDGIVNGDQLTFVLSGLGAGRGTATLVRSGAVLQGSLVDALPAGTIRGPFTLTNPTATSTSTTGGSTGAAAGANLPGSIGGPTTVSPTPIGGTGTGTGTGGLGSLGGSPIPTSGSPAPGTGPITLGP